MKISTRFSHFLLLLLYSLLQVGKAVTVSEFCSASNLALLESRLAALLVAFYGDSTTLTFRTENGAYVCRCDQAASNDSLSLTCSTQYNADFGVEDGIDDGTTFANRETLMWTLDQDDNLWTPTNVSWVDGVKLAYEDSRNSAIGDTLTFTTTNNNDNNNNNTLLIASCEIFSTPCDEGNFEGACQVCDDGLSVAIDHPCYSTIACEEQYRSSFFNQMYVEGEIDLILDNDDDDDDELAENELCTEDMMTVEDYCSSDFSALEAEFNDILAGFYEGTYHNFTWANDTAFQCECTEITNNSFSLFCPSSFYLEDGGAEETTDETMVFQKFGNVYKVTQVGWCESQSGCYTYSVSSFDHDKLSGCNHDGCDDYHCALCSDGISVAASCFDLTCADSYPGSAFLPYSNTTLCAGTSDGDDEGEIIPDE